MTSSYPLSSGELSVRTDATGGNVLSLVAASLSARFLGGRSLPAQGATYSHSRLSPEPTMQAATKMSGWKIVWLISFGGFVSALVTILILWFWTIAFPGLVFGLVLAAFFGKRGIFTERQAGWFIAVSAFAHIISFYLVARLGLDAPSMSNPDDASLLEFLAGGVLGGFLVVGAFPLILDKRTKRRAAIISAIPWSMGGAVAGGALAVIGVLLGTSLGAGIFDTLQVLHLLPFHGNGWLPNDWYSLYLVWQTGIALMLGIIVHRYSIAGRTKEEIEQP